MMKNDSALFFTCSLIEYMGREKKRYRKEVVLELGEVMLRRIYKHADVLHCEPIAKTADEFISIINLEEGTFDNVKKCRYEVPDYWTIGEVYERLIEDIAEKDVIDTLVEVYSSWISDSISNYNTDFYYQSREYIRECYRAGTVL